MKKLLDSDWLRTVQFFLNTVRKRGNWMQKKVIKQAFWLVNEQRSSQIANQIFCFQIKRAPWMAQFFLDCVIIKITWGLARAQNWEESSESVKFKTSFSQFFSCILLIGNHTVFLVQAARAIWAFWKTHSCKLIPNWTRNRMITYTNTPFFSLACFFQSCITSKSLEADRGNIITSHCVVL